MEDLKPYAEYRMSGVPWLEEIPEHWEIKPLKHWIRINRSVLSETTPNDYEFNYLDIGTVGTGVLTQLPQRLHFGSAPSRARRVVRTGDTIVSTVRTYLRAVYHVADASGELVASTGFAVLTPRAFTEPRFVSYLAQSEAFTNQVTAESMGTAYPAIAEGVLGRFHIGIPPLAEQAAIARFLNYTDRRIARYIRAKRQLIVLLDEQKQATIHRAVTHGLNSRVRLAPSGVNWLGDVPVHWKVKRVKNVSKVLRGKFTHRPRNDPSLYDGPYPFLQTGDVARAAKLITSYKQTLNEKGLAVSKIFPRGTLAMTIAANIGDVAVLDFDACFPDSVVGFVPQPEIDRDFLFYVFRGMKAELLTEAPVNTQGNLNIERISSRAVPVPPPEEQKQIVRFIEGQMQELDKAVIIARRGVSLVREYRARLIADVVTGKLDVREAAAKLPEEPQELVAPDVAEVLEGEQAPALVEAEVGA